MIEVKGLTKVYRSGMLGRERKKALDNVSFTLDNGALAEHGNPVALPQGYRLRKEKGRGGGRRRWQEANAAMQCGGQPAWAIRKDADVPLVDNRRRIVHDTIS